MQRARKFILLYRNEEVARSISAPAEAHARSFIVIRTLASIEFLGGGGQTRGERKREGEGESRLSQAPKPFRGKMHVFMGHFDRG